MFEFMYPINASANDGTYRIEAIGIVKGIYTIFIDVVPSPHSTLQSYSTQVSGIIDSMQSNVYEINYHSTPGTPIAFRKIVSSNTIRQDIQVSYASNWLGDRSLYDDLNQRLDSFDGFLSQRDSVRGRNILQGLQTKINAAAQQSAGSFFITLDAYQILSSDAATLLTQFPPNPIVESLAPSSTVGGSSGFVLNVKGKSFVSGSAILWKGSSRLTSFIGDSLLQATILTSDLATAGTVNVAVVNPGNDTSNVLPFTITKPPSSLSVKLINSTGTNLTSGSLQYYDGTWKDATNNNDGTFSINTSLKTLSLRMTYEGGSQTKSNVAVGTDIVVFQTIDAQVKLQNSQGALIDTGSVQYYAGAWRSFGTTTSGIATKELLPGSYSFRITYASGSNDKQQDIGSNPAVVFQTVNASVQLRNSQGTLMDQGTVQYYAGTWRSFGATANGIVSKELLPNNYSFRMTYAFASKDQQQNIGTNTTVVFQTVNATVQLKNSQGALIDQGAVQYYSGAWRSFGTTSAGSVSKELLPISYSFRMTNEGVSNDKAQDLSANSIVSFSTVLCTVSVKNSQSQPVDNAQISYYSGAWKQIGPTVSGQVTKELLPANLTFRMTLGTTSQDKAQNIGTNALVEFVVQ